MRKKAIAHSPDKVFLALNFVLLLTGLAFLASASMPLAQIRYQNPYFFLKHQILFGLIPGIVGFLIGYFTYYQYWKKLSVPLFAITLIFLLLIFTPLGVIKKGAKRWLNIFGFSFQPSQLAKLSFIIYLAAWLSSKEQRGVFSNYLPFLTISGILALLLIKEPATGMTVLLLGTALILYFAGKGRIIYILLTVIAGGIILGYLIISTPYRWQRFKAFLNPNSDPLGSTYQIKQGLIALGSGGLIGKGYSNSVLKQKFIPEVFGDSIFAVIGEETGFVGTSLLILLYLAIFLRSLKIAFQIPDNFGKLTVLGFSVILILEAFINIYSVSSIIPFTGLSLPLISYGGTSLAIYLTMIGIIGNISKYTKAVK